MDPSWKCAWCDGTCQFSIHCQQSAIWQSPDLICGRPIIDTVHFSWSFIIIVFEKHFPIFNVCRILKYFQFEPQSGPMEGGTRIEIRGRDLGSSLGEIKGRVFVAGSKCEVIEFEIASR